MDRPHIEIGKLDCKQIDKLNIWGKGLLDYLETRTRIWLSWAKENAEIVANDVMEKH